VWVEARLLLGLLGLGAHWSWSLRSPLCLLNERNGDPGFGRDLHGMENLRENFFGHDWNDDIRD